MKIRRAISLASDIVTLRRLLHWIAWSFRYQIDLSIVEFAQEMMELRRYYWPTDFRSYMIESLQAGNKGLTPFCNAMGVQNEKINILGYVIGHFGGVMAPRSTV